MLAWIFSTRPERPRRTMTTPHDAPIEVSRPNAPASVNITSPEEVDFWTRQLGVSELDLRRAVADAGVAAADVRDFLGVSQGAPG